ncbi:MAG: phosphate ABC transporter, permease protein PstA, partial [Oscillospiraceae bacterium]
MNYIKHKFKAYKKSPLSLLLLLSVWVAAIITVSVLLFLVGYILTK